MFAAQKRWVACAFIFAAQMLTAAEPWKLVWSDEFDGAKLDFTKWAVEENGHGGGNNELQYYVDRPQNVRVKDGHLVIEALRESFNQAGVRKDFTSGRIRTKHRADWKYCRVEVRAKLPTGRGLWPAVWMLPSEEKYGGWASSGEIDIIEMVGHEPNKLHATLHFGGRWPKNQQATKAHTLPKGTFADDFHVFAMEWDRDEFRWYLDGKEYAKQREWRSESGEFPAPFDQPFFLIINLAVGGQWPGPPDKQTVFPQSLQVDYVRVYQKPAPTSVK